MCVSSAVGSCPVFLLSRSQLGRGELGKRLDAFFVAVKAVELGPIEVGLLDDEAQRTVNEAEQHEQ